MAVLVGNGPVGLLGPVAKVPQQDRRMGLQLPTPLECHKMQSEIHHIVNPGVSRKTLLKKVCFSSGLAVNARGTLGHGPCTETVKVYESTQPLIFQ